MSERKSAKVEVLAKLFRLLHGGKRVRRIVNNYKVCKYRVPQGYVIEVRTLSVMQF